MAGKLLQNRTGRELQAWAMGSELMAFCESEAPRLLAIHQRLRAQLERVISIQGKRLDELMLGECGDPPEGTTKAQHYANQVDYMASCIASNVAVLGNLDKNYLTMTAGGTAAVWAAIQRASTTTLPAPRRQDADEVVEEGQHPIRTVQRKRYGAGEAQVLDA